MNAQTALLSALVKITGTGNFHSVGHVPFFFPQLAVEGMGEFSFPLAQGQAKQLIALAEAAPFGKGERTVLDDKVRKCWQIDASAFVFHSPAWAEYLRRTVDSISEDLGIRGKVSAVPYKLLVYAKGGHFKPHKDTEKLDAMFGSLIIALPSRHDGGRLFIRHDGNEAVVDFSDPARSHDFQHAAFFADCEHEVEPVRSGYRLCVVYNLRLEKGDSALLNLPLTAQSQGLIPALGELKKERGGQLSAVLLEHSYTEANLALRTLKGNDQARALALLSAAVDTGFTAHLGLVTLHQTGMLEDRQAHSFRRRGRGRAPGPEDGTMGEIGEESLSISHWRDVQDRKVDLGDYSIEPDALITKEAIDQGDPDQKEAEPFTGNEGCTMDYWYRRAAIVLWAKEDDEHIQCEQDFRGACVNLHTMATKKAATQWAAFCRLAEAIISFYPEQLGSLPRNKYATPSDDTRDPLCILLAALAESKSEDLFRKLMQRLPPYAFVLCDPTLWDQLFQAFGAEAFDEVVTELMKADPEYSRKPLFQMLAALSKMKDGSRVQRIAPHVARYDQQPPITNSFTGDVEPSAIMEGKILLAASHMLVSLEDRDAVQSFLQSDGSLSHIRMVLGPILLDKSTASLFGLANSLAPTLRASARDILEQEVKQPLIPYTNWVRPCAMGASSSFNSIQELATFMADPSAQTHRFARPEDQQTRIAEFVKKHRLDVSCATIREEGPPILACTKNDYSYRSAVAKRAKHEEMLRSFSQQIAEAL